ncbi:MAG TPA: hypothetical protein VI934_02040 [Candidatus Nanoarchaeia archaeon]|nr:hypothetical protein [Candidatus Nanoarchaeia archaeon]
MAGYIPQQQKQLPGRVKVTRSLDTSLATDNGPGLETKVDNHVDTSLAARVKGKVTSYLQSKPGYK